MNEVDSLISKIADKILNPIIGLMVAIAVVVFIYGVVEFIANADNEDKRKLGKDHMIWGIVGLFIMVSVFGLMNIVAKFWN